MVTPHVASATPEGKTRMFVGALEGVVQVLKGETPGASGQSRSVERGDGLCCFRKLGLGGALSKRRKTNVLFQQKTLFTEQGVCNPLFLSFDYHPDLSP